MGGVANTVINKPVIYAGRDMPSSWIINFRLLWEGSIPWEICGYYVEGIINIGPRKYLVNGFISEKKISFSKVWVNLKFEINTSHSFIANFPENQQ